MNVEGRRESAHRERWLDSMLVGATGGAGASGRQSRRTECGVFFHRCAGCNEDEPDIEIVGRKMCFHSECHKEWMEDCKP